MKKIWIMAGEASGDVYGAALARELQRIAAAKGEPLQLAGMGGNAMRDAGVDLKVDSTELGVVGIFEVLKLIGTFVRIFFYLKRLAIAERPDAVILIDYPGFNLRFAKVMYRAGIPVIWYVCPHLWVWGKGRLPVLAKICRAMLVIFPFEVEVFAPTQLRATFVGHPLTDIVSARHDPSLTRDPNTFLLLPGSRAMEVDKLLRPMLTCCSELARKHPELKFHLAAPREKIALRCTTIIESYRRQHPELPEIVMTVGDTPKWQQIAGTGLAASGTVTVECALSGLPLVVGYKLNFLTLLVAAVLVKLYRGFFTMVNIIVNREVFKEFFQWRFAPKNLLPAIEEILPGGSRRTEVETGMAEMSAMLRADSGSAAARAARECWAKTYGENSNG